LDTSLESTDKNISKIRALSLMFVQM